MGGGVDKVVSTVTKGVTKVVSTVTKGITEITCSTFAKSNQNTYVCCRSEVTALGAGCITNANILPDTPTQAFITQFNCFNKTDWINTYTTVNGKQTNSANTTAIKADVSGYRSTVFCYRSLFCLSWCVTTNITLGFYVAAEPLFAYKLQVFKINNNSERINIDYKFKEMTLWSVASDYNFNSFKNINNYIESTEGFGYCTGIPNTTGIKLMTFNGPYLTTNMSIFTTLITNKLINSAYTTDTKTYYIRIKIYATYILKSYYEYYKKVNKLIVKDDNTRTIILQKLLKTDKINYVTVQKYLVEIFNNFYTNDSTFSFYLRRLDACIYFIYNIIKKNADDKGITVDDLFLNNFYNLIFDNYIINLYMDTSLINTYFSNIIPEILTENYDNILNNWLNFILLSINNPTILASKYAPLYVPYKDLNNDNYTEQILTYSNLEVVNDRFNYYRSNVVYSEKCRPKYIQYSALPLDVQQNILTKIRAIKINTSNIKNKTKKSGCGSKKKSGCGCK